MSSDMWPLWIGFYREVDNDDEEEEHEITNQDEPAHNDNDEL
jgi:hypothetical protein